MSRTWHQGERRIRVRSIRKDNPDPKRIARALIVYARAQAEKDAELETRRARRRSTTPSRAKIDRTDTGDAA
jgi:hypothetical protein